MKTIIGVLALAFGVNAFAAMAFFTGRQELVTTVTYQTGWRCEYNYAGQKFWRVFTSNCPSSVEVQ